MTSVAFVRRFAFLVAALFCLGVMAAKPSQAAPISYQFGGTIGSVDPLLSPPFSATDTFTGSYTIESTTAARAGSNSNFAFFDAVTSFDIVVSDAASAVVYSASLSSATGRREVQVDNDPGAPFSDRYGISTFSSDGLVGANVNALALMGISFRLDDSTDSVFNDALMLPIDISFSDFDSSGFFMFFGPNFNTVSGTLTSLTQVPEPGALELAASSLLALALFGLAVRRRESSARA